MIAQLKLSEGELREVVTELIRHRELVGMYRLERLQREAARLARRLRDNQVERLREGIACFKDILALHKKLIDENDEPGNRGEDTEARSG